MKLYDPQGNQVHQTPPVLFHGLSGETTTGIRQLEEIIKRGNLPSKALKIKEGTFDWEEYLRIKRHNIWGEDKVLEMCSSLLAKGFLDPQDIRTVKIEGFDLAAQHEFYYPSPFQSTTTLLQKSVEYAGIVKRPVLVFSPTGLEGIDLRGRPYNGCSEIIIFDNIPIENLVGVVYFFEKPSAIKKMLADRGLEKVQVIKGYTEGFRYRALRGGYGFNIPLYLDQHELAKQFYEKTQRKVELRISTLQAP